MSSYKLGKNVAKMLKNVDELAAQAERFGNFEIAHKLQPVAVEIPPDETVGLDLMFDKVWKSIEEENVGVIGLYGMGGVGKTTLLNKINNELGKKMLEFNVVIFVTISKGPNLDSAMDTIRQRAGIRDDIWKQCSNREEKAAKIYGVLKQKKFVLLLDDIWESIDLKLVGVPHPKDTNFHSKVLFTTRFEDVCGRMQAQRKFKVEILTEDEALKLFRMKVGEETLRSHPNIPKLAEEMAMECKGLPLALNVLGSSMAGVKSIEAWEHSKNNLMSSAWTAPNLESEVFSILRFSYDNLPDEVHKKCFLYCALFPEDYGIQVFELIDKWICEGFLCRDMTKSVQDMHHHGESIIEKLKLSCLLENAQDDFFLTRKVKMHDVIRDMALWLACNQDESHKRVLVQGDAFTMSQDDIESWKVVERISIINYDESVLSIPPCPNLMAFVLNCKSIEGLQNIQYMSKLKVLELKVSAKGILNVPAGIGGLVLLEYLSLDGNIRTSEFLIELKKLTNLKFLCLKMIKYDDAAAINIPLGVISSLQKLRALAFLLFVWDEIKEERELLEEMESLSKIERLSINIIRTKNGLEKLLESAKLQCYICDLNLLGIDALINMRLLLASLSKMKQLRELVLDGLKRVEDSSVFDKCCLTMLRRVDIFYCDSITHVTWLKYAPLLQQLHIGACRLIEEVIKEEETKDENGMENVDPVFSSLVRLFLLRLPELKSIHRTVLTFPFLRSIEITLCPNLKKLPFDSNSAKHKLREIKGGEDWWKNLAWDDSATKDKFQSKFQISPWE